VTVGTDTRKLPLYDEPPIVEVAFSVLFPSLEGLLSPHIGLLWQGFQPEYPFCDDVVPIAPRVEVFGGQNVEPQFKITDVPPLPRAWFINQDGTRVIQIQRDRFIHNWRKVDTGSEYPSYETLIKTFQHHLGKFDSFLVETELGKVQPIQYELTYVNQIPQGKAWLTFEDISKVFPDISWRASSSRFLSHPQTISWTTVFDLPDSFGRLHTAVKPSSLNEKPTLLFELTVRGIGNYTSLALLKNWFDAAHNYIVYAFADLTDKETQTKIWKRRG
jgi:uncharacterized protein (TIGR04255 family)